MANNDHQPKADDAILGNQASPLFMGAVLGGLEGVQKRLTDASAEQRIAALSEALKYGSAGLKLVIQSLQDESRQVQWKAYQLLRQRTEPDVQRVVREHLPLISQMGVDYTQLQNLLSAQKWKEADEETKALLLQASHRENKWLRRDDIEQLSCADLGTIERLWITFSHGRFGFSVQRRIWQECLQTQQAQKSGNAHDCFGERVGWHTRKNPDWGGCSFFMERVNEIPFNLSAPVGHLPSVCSFGGGKTERQPYTNDTESVMGFYSIDGYRNEWVWDSFFGPFMVECFLNRVQICEL